jgi:hypothetical protein
MIPSLEEPLTQTPSDLDLRLFPIGVYSVAGHEKAMDAIHDSVKQKACPVILESRD